jgi:hypothetical protein
MQIPQIAKKYGISEAFLNAKDDALLIAADSLLDVKGMVQGNHPREEIAAKLQFLSDFLRECKNANH